MKRYLIDNRKFHQAGEAQDIVMRSSEIVVCCQGIAPHWVRRVDGWHFSPDPYKTPYGYDDEHIVKAVFSALVTGNAVVTDEAAE